MLHQIGFIDRTSRILATRAVVTAASLALAGSAFGLSVGVLQGRVTGLELWLVASGFLFSACILAAFFALPVQRYRAITLAAILYYAFYLSAGLVLSAYAVNLNVFVYMFWFFPLLAFNILMRTSGAGGLLHGAILLLPLLLLAVNAGQIMHAYPPATRSYFVVFALAYLCFGLVLHILSKYREAFIEGLLGAAQIPRTALARAQPPPGATRKQSDLLQRLARSGWRCAAAPRCAAIPPGPAPPR